MNNTILLEVKDHLWGQLFACNLVEMDNLSREDFGRFESLRTKNHFGNDVKVGHHHGHRTNKDLQVVRKLYTTSEAVNISDFLLISHFTFGVNTTKNGR